MMEIGDKVKVIAETGGHKFAIGSIVKCSHVEKDGVHLFETGNDPDGSWYLSDNEYEAFADEKKGALTLSVDISTQAMKEFADHCERAADALERIKDALK